MFRRLGIGGRLFLAFLCITGLSLSSGVASWLILRHIAAAQAVVNTKALPAIAETQHIAELSARLVAAAPALAAVRSPAELSAEQAELSRLSREMVESLDHLKKFDTDKQLVEAFAGSVEKMLANLKNNYGLVRQRLEQEAAYRRSAEKVTDAAQSILLLSETLISNASAGASAVTASLYGLITDPARREDAYSAIDRLIEHDIFLMERMYELRHRSAQINLLINRLTRAETLAEQPMFREAFARRRCLVPANGFYEWHGVRKRPYWLAGASGLSYFAAVWEAYPVDGHTWLSLALVTQAAGPMRRPLLLESEEERALWLGDETPVPKLLSLLARPQVRLREQALASIVNDPACDGPECLTPA